MPIAKEKSMRPVLTKGPRQNSVRNTSALSRVSNGSDGGGAAPSHLEVQYNPEIINGLLQDLGEQVDAKCALIEKDIDFMATSIQQAFHLELIKLPTQVKKMSLARFREEFGDSLEAVTRGAMGSLKSGSSRAKVSKNRRDNVGSAVGKGGQSSSSRENLDSRQQRQQQQQQQQQQHQHVFTTATKPVSSQSRVFETPSAQVPRSAIAQTPGTARQPRLGEIVLSQNGSPLGEYQPTVVKAARPEGGGFAPPTPGTANIAPPAPAAGPSLMLCTGEALDLDNVDVGALPDEAKADALAQMQAMMENMQAMMLKLSGTLTAQADSSSVGSGSER